MTLPIPIFRKTFVGRGIRCESFHVTISVSYGNAFLYVFNYPDESIISCETMIVF